MVPERIEVDETAVTFTWPDGVEAVIEARTLRAACECAVCREPRGAEAIGRLLAADAAITISDARLVGGYAVQFTFAPDDHRTGIYPFERLRSLASSSDASS